MSRRSVATRPARPSRLLRFCATRHRLSVSADVLLFDKDERGPRGELMLKFEAVEGWRMRRSASWCCSLMPT